MFMAIAAETAKHPTRRTDYKIWYLEIDERGDVVGIGVKTREELVKDLFQQYRELGRSNWRAFLKGAEKSTKIELTDFISQNLYENTHFGDLPSLGEFQETLNYLKMNLELRSIA